MPGAACPTSSSISSSDPWRRFARTVLLTGLAIIAILYGFVVTVDPWDTLPLSPPLPRVPISGNARFSFPALARSTRFDSAVFGTSTSRLLQPAQLDPAFGARFANLSMNSATAWEQAQLLRVFLRAHPIPRVVIIGLDSVWCSPTAERTTPRPFPDWMYRANPWPGYREMLTPFAIQEAANQLATMLRLKRPRYGNDGYTSFVPDDTVYDPVRVDAAFTRWPPLDMSPAGSGNISLPAMAELASVLAAIPGTTRVILYFPPISVEQHGPPGSTTLARWDACKREAVRMAAPKGAEVLDMLFPTPITTSRTNYWDPLHYRASVAAHVAATLAKPEEPEVRRLSPHAGL